MIVDLAVVGPAQRQVVIGLTKLIEQAAATGPGQGVVVVHRAPTAAGPGPRQRHHRLTPPTRAGQHPLADRGGVHQVVGAVQAAVQVAGPILPSTPRRFSAWN